MFTHYGLHKNSNRGLLNIMLLAALIGSFLPALPATAAQMADLPPRVVVGSPYAPDSPVLTVDKTLLAPAGRSTLLIGEEAVFQIVVTNTGDSTIIYVPQTDEFDNACLMFAPKADPVESSYDNARGIIEWANLVISNGHYLAPGESFTTTVRFDVVGSSNNGYNTGIVSGAVDENNQSVPVASDIISLPSPAPRRPASAITSGTT